MIDGCLRRRYGLPGMGQHQWRDVKQEGRKASCTEAIRPSWVLSTFVTRYILKSQGHKISTGDWTLSHCTATSLSPPL